MAIDLETREGGVLVVSLNEPDRRNPLGHPVRQELVRVLSDAEGEDDVRAVVLTGKGGHFSVGGDIRDQGTRSVAQQRERFATVKDMVSRMVRFSKPLVVAVEGWAAGGGFALVMACPTIVASREAKFVASFTKIGLIPDMGLLATLPARVGPARARRIIMSNRKIAADEALAMGMVDELVDEGQAVDAACAIALEEAAGAPLPRQFIADWFARDVDAALEYERMIQPILLNSEDAAEGRAAFFEKRPAKFQGR
ncbi:enoyl-CoA hydratase/isomerase family protein [Litoreibacter arenae]|uniref:Enoyl-CoA hydratase n=1 Tax=Litoreibacter arenae DSM 19593 TaxID=1123360 RepID=S9RT58_9RHOB|nr:enoyl-CoA hydratase/isomerase family protein [Litoreibacter arenae]EPX77099.1 Enoyl-CoA hydratase [Litoreibacter arenae DSM 19593]